LVLCEGGPRLLGSLLAARAVDELFLTLAPQVAGRADDGARPGLVSGHAFEPETAPWARLVGVKHHGEHLYLRYGF
jgi:riboflavin biosynthesis pyrimidine reductase